jgi:hypothetical protein
MAFVRNCNLRFPRALVQQIVNTKPMVPTVVCCSVCDRDAAVLGNRTQSMNVITHAVQITMHSSCSYVKNCEQF